jgi:hypothetical protein
VAGVKAFAKKPAVLTPGVAYVRWRGWERSEGAFVSTWALVIILPQQDEESADTWIYAHADTLEDALRPVMYVESFQPASVPAESGANPRGLFALQINGRSE